MDTPKRTAPTKDAFSAYCDLGIVYSICALVFVLPASIALVDSFAALAIFIYFVKKINLLIIDWPVKNPLLGFAPPANFLNQPLQFLTLAIFVSVLFSQFPMLSLYAFFGKFIKYVFLYCSFIEVFNDEKRIRTFLKFFIASVFVTALSGVVQHYTGRDFIKGHHFGYENLVLSQRVNSSFFSANGFGAYLLPAIGLVAHLLFSAVNRSKSWLLKAGLSLILVMLLSCLCWTYSRSSWVGYLIILIMMCLMDRRKSIFAAILLLIFIFIFLPSLNQVRNVNLINDNSSGTRMKNEDILTSIKPSGDVGSGRLDYWKKALSIIYSSPIVGTGLNTYTRVIGRDPNPGVRRYAHNCYLQMGAETGLLGLGCFLWLLFVLMRNGLHFCTQIKGLWPLTFLQGALAGLSGFLVQSFFDNTFYTVQLGVLLWLMIGLMVAVTRLTIFHGKKA